MAPEVLLKTVSVEGKLWLLRVAVELWATKNDCVRGAEMAKRYYRHDLLSVGLLNVQTGSLWEHPLHPPVC